MKRSEVFLAVLVLASAGMARAVNYDFLPIVSTGSATSQFNSLNGNGYIGVTDSFPAGGAGYADNNNSLIYPSQFTTLFPGTGQVQGHLGMTVYNYRSVVTFDLTNYTITPLTKFGMWNTSDEVSAPVGGNPVYQIQLMDASNSIVNPTTFNLFGKQDNQTQVLGRHELDMNPADGVITPGALINGGYSGSGIHTSATFWDNIPTTTKEIIVYIDLPPLNTIGDGVGYYFAEVQVPEPTTLTLLGAGASMLLWRRRK